MSLPLFIDTAPKKARPAPFGATYDKTFVYIGSAQNQMPLLTELNAFCLIEAIKISLLRSWIGTSRNERVAEIIVY